MELDRVHSCTIQLPVLCPERQKQLPLQKKIQHEKFSFVPRVPAALKERKLPVTLFT